LKQAAEYWYRNLSSTIIQLGYRPTMHDKCVFVKNDPVTTVTTYVIIYVDDVLIISADDSEIDNVVHQIRSAYTAITVVVQSYPLAFAIGIRQGVGRSS
jgi:hypothetical protein